MMEHLEKNITQIFEQTYKIPLYQRNFAWEEGEVEKLLQDIYQSFKSNPVGEYFIGSLTTLQRKDGEYEVIDGQQRLTVLSLVTRILNNDNPNSLFCRQALFYDSRPDVEKFLKKFYRNPYFNDEEKVAATANFRQAIFTIMETCLDVTDKDLSAKIGNQDWNDFNAFKDYFENNVILVCVRLPEDTDVASYFEIMNNRGAQLQEHEIIKARLMANIKKRGGSFDTDKQRLFAYVWDACSQMDCHIQKNFDAPMRKKLFSKNYDSFCWNVDEAVSVFYDDTGKSIKKDSDSLTQQKSIRDIVGDRKTLNKYINEAMNVLEKKGNEDDDKIEEVKFYSIIDFPNFLMQVFKVYYEQDFGESISLHDNFLISTFDKIEKLGLIRDPMDFAGKLLWCRTVFDRYVVKTTDPVIMNWSLKHAYLSNQSLQYGLTFGKCEKSGIPDDEKESEETNRDNEICEKILSMLQVTFRSKYYKNFLQYILRFFKDRGIIKVKASDYIRFLNFIMVFRFEKYKKSEWLNRGEKTPHYVFNFIDYLLWFKSRKNYGTVSFIDCPNFKINPFVFRNLNSVEHHLARNVAVSKDSSEDTNKYTACVNFLGNLYLIGKNDNSRLNDRFVEQKINDFFKGDELNRGLNLGPNRQIMYCVSKIKGWSDVQIKNHQRDLTELLGQSFDLLGLSKKDVKEIAMEYGINDND